MILLPPPRHVNLDAGWAEDRVQSQGLTGALPPQGYQLKIGRTGAEILGGDEAGLFYADMTLRQLSRLTGGRLPQGTICDFPDFQVRGVMLDISRDKVPKLDNLFALISRLAEWKINHLQLYTEHTFAYQDHPDVHRCASPLTHDDIRAIDHFCRRHHVELAPNQNCLGHMGRWLKLDGYRDLALAPDGFVNPFGMRLEPMSLDPSNPAAFELVAGLLKELLPNFSSERVHIGLDEVWELEPQRIGEFADWVLRLKKMNILQKREVLIWGDMVTEHPQILERLKDSVTFVEWGYEADHPFAARAAALSAAGARFWLAPGTSSWLSLAGRWSNARENCLRAAEAGLAHGAEGYLVTDWGDQGHLQPQIFSEAAFAWAAALAWNLEGARTLDLAAALSQHVYLDPSGTFCSLMQALGDAYQLVTPRPLNCSGLVQHLYYPQLRLGTGVTRGLTRDELLATNESLLNLRSRISGLSSSRADKVQAIEELTWTTDLLIMLVDDAQARLAGEGLLSSIPQTDRTTLRRRLEELIAQHERLWRIRNRPGGLADSLAWLQNLAAAYETGHPVPDWAGVSAESNRENFT
jgi:hexosaminidase